MPESTLIDALAGMLAEGRLIPYLGPRMLQLCDGYVVPETPEALVQSLTAKASVPGKIRNNLTRSAQFIENFKHRKTLVHLMDQAFTAPPVASELHLALAALKPPLIVDTWYDDAMGDALDRVHAADGERDAWGQVQGLSQSEHFGQWTGRYDARGHALAEDARPDWRTLLYKPLGGHAPAANYLVSDTDFVEVLTEIDIQTPIPAAVQRLRSSRSFLFIGCRFDDQLTRGFARQIMKRSSDRHWAVLPEPLTRMEARFLAEQNISRIELPLATFAERMLERIGAAAAA